MKSVWVANLSDNVYRLAGVGGTATVAELRQAVKRIDLSLKVGQTVETPLQSLLGAQEMENLALHLQSVAVNPARRTCQRLMWFLYWQPSDAAPQTPEALEGHYTATNMLCRTQAQFLQAFLGFLETRSVEHLQTTLNALRELLNHKTIRRKGIEVIAEAEDIESEQAERYWDEARPLVAESVIGAAVQVALFSFENGAYEQGCKVVEAITEADLPSEWMEPALRPLAEVGNALARRLQEAAKSLDEWTPNFKDPCKQDYARLTRLAKLLRGRLTAAMEWEAALQGWTDALAHAMGNYAVRRVNEQMEKIGSMGWYTPDHEKRTAAKELARRMGEARHILKAALELETSEMTRMRLKGLFLEFEQMIAQMHPALILEAKRANPFASASSQGDETSESSGASPKRMFWLFVIIVMSISLCAWILNSTNTSNSSSSSPPVESNFDSASDSSDYTATSSSSSYTDTSYTITPSMNGYYAPPRNPFQEPYRLYRAKQYSKAASAYANAIQNARYSIIGVPNEHYYYYGICLRKSKQRSKAIWAFRTYLQNEANGVYRSDALRQLREMGALRRLKMGAAPFGRGVYNGYCQLKIINDTHLDAVVQVVTPNNRSVRNFYIPASSWYRADSLPPGEYQLIIFRGLDWDNKAKRFTLYEQTHTSEYFTLEQWSDGYTIHYTRTEGRLSQL